MKGPVETLGAFSHAGLQRLPAELSNLIRIHPCDVMALRDGGSALYQPTSGDEFNAPKVAERLAICRVQRSVFTNAPHSFGPLQPPSAQTRRGKGSVAVVDFKPPARRHEPEHRPCARQADQKTNPVGDDATLAALDRLCGTATANPIPLSVWPYALPPDARGRQAEDGSCRASRCRATHENSAAPLRPAECLRAASATGTPASRGRGRIKNAAQVCPLRPANTV